jgi:hypothetical protein
VAKPDQAQSVPYQMKAQVALCLSPQDGRLPENRVLRRCVAVVGVCLVGAKCEAMPSQGVSVVYVHPAPVRAAAPVSLLWLPVCCEALP